MLGDSGPPGPTRLISGLIMANASMAMSTSASATRGSIAIAAALIACQEFPEAGSGRQGLGAPSALLFGGDIEATRDSNTQPTRALDLSGQSSDEAALMTDHRTREEIEHDRILEERAAPYTGRTLTEAERHDQGSP